MLSYSDFMKVLSKNPVIGVLRAPTKDLALEAITVCCEAGFDQIEVTYTTPETEQVIEASRRKFPKAIIGAGTVMNPAQVMYAKNHGAHFLVSPYLDADIIAEALKIDACYIPGAATPTELMQAAQMGCQIQKLFPANIHGPAGVKGILAPLPELNLIVTGGVNEQTGPEFLKNGAKGICIGSNIFTDELWKTKDWSLLEKAVAPWVKK